jgi:hypothetical protein
MIRRLFARAVCISEKARLDLKNDLIQVAALNYSKKSVGINIGELTAKLDNLLSSNGLTFDLGIDLLASRISIDPNLGYKVCMSIIQDFEKSKSLRNLNLLLKHYPTYSYSIKMVIETKDFYFDFLKKEIGANNIYSQDVAGILYAYTYNRYIKCKLLLPNKANLGVIYEYIKANINNFQLVELSLICSIVKRLCPYFCTTDIMGIIDTRLDNIFTECNKEFGLHVKILPAKMMLEYIYAYEANGWYVSKHPYLTEALLKLVKSFFESKGPYSFNSMGNLLEVFIYYGQLFPELFKTMANLSSGKAFSNPKGIHSCIQHRASIEKSTDQLKLLKECIEIIQSKIKCPQERTEFQKQVDYIITKMQCSK